MIEMKVTLTDDEGHRRRSKVTKNESMVISRKILYSQTSYPKPRHNTRFLDLEVRSRSHVKVKGHRRGGVCVLRMLLVVLCLRSRYDVYECNSLRDMTIDSFFVTFDLHL